MSPFYPVEKEQNVEFISMFKTMKFKSAYAGTSTSEEFYQPEISYEVLEKIEQEIHKGTYYIYYKGKDISTPQQKWKNSFSHSKRGYWDEYPIVSPPEVSRPDVNPAFTTSTHRLVKQEYEVPFDVQERDRRGWELLGKIVNDQEKIKSFRRCEGDLLFKNSKGSTLVIIMTSWQKAEITYCNYITKKVRNLRVRQLFDNFGWCLPDSIVSVILTFLNDDNDFLDRMKCGNLSVDEPMRSEAVREGVSRQDIFYHDKEESLQDMIYPVDFTKQ